jgi:hypothetical protein
VTRPVDSRAPQDAFARGEKKSELATGAPTETPPWTFSRPHRGDCLAVAGGRPEPPRSPGLVGLQCPEGGADGFGIPLAQVAQVLTGGPQAAGDGADACVTTMEEVGGQGTGFLRLGRLRIADRTRAVEPPGLALLRQPESEVQERVRLRLPVQQRRTIPGPTGGAAMVPDRGEAREPLRSFAPANPCLGREQAGGAKGS